MSRLVPHIMHRPRTLLAAALGAVALAATLASPTLASAAQPYETTIVYYNLLDLATDQGTRAVYRRIVNAAETVCPSESSLNPGDIAAAKECQQQTIARAVAQIGNARLAAEYARASARHG